MPATPEFSTVHDEYVTLKLHLNEYVGSSRELLPGFVLASSPPPESVRVEEERLLRLNFSNWGVPFNGELPGWRDESPIFITFEKRLVAGLYLCFRNEFDGDERWGQLHYFFVEQQFKDLGLHDVAFDRAVRNARNAGLSGVYINTDRPGLAELYSRCGASVYSRRTRTRKSTLWEGWSAAENGRDGSGIRMAAATAESGGAGGNPQAERADLDDRITASLLELLHGKLGHSREAALKRAGIELSREIPRRFLSGLPSPADAFSGKRILDVGAGMGGLALEMALQGASVVALEPDPGWRGIAAERLATARDASSVGGAGELLPFRSSSFDMAVSLQVLEHVSDPEAVLREVFRVLRPGGLFCFSCENYLSFWEPHYSVFWFPLFPKTLGSWYLRLRGRSPEFLNRAINYTTILSIRRASFRAGFVSLWDEVLRGKLTGKVPITGWKARILPLLLRLLPADAVISLAIFITTARKLFRRGVEDILIKPAAVAPACLGSEYQSAGRRLK